MNKLTEELQEELGAFDPRWQRRYPSMGAAARAAGVLPLYSKWAKTPDGVRYLSSVSNLPDRVGDAKREAAAMSAPQSLPFGYANFNDMYPEVFDNEEASE